MNVSGSDNVFLLLSLTLASLALCLALSLPTVSLTQHLTVFVAVGSCISCGIGWYPDWIFFCGFIGMFMFFCAHWQTYVSGTLRFGL